MASFSGRTGVVPVKCKLKGEVKMNTSDTEAAGTLLALSNNLASAVERASAGTVAIYARERIPSSGIIWREGVIATAAHTIKREEEITVLLPDGRTLPAQLAARDSGTDLAILKFDDTKVPAAEIVDASSLKVGHIVLGVGRVSEHGPTASLGIISALGGPWRTWRGGQIDQLIRLDMGVYDGFSGGPLVNTQGGVLGINTSGLSRGGGLTVPASTVNRVVDELMTRGHIARPYIGVGMQPVSLPDSITSRLNLEGHGGVIVLSVEPGGPAENAGLLMGDVIVALGGKTVADTDDVQAALGPEPVGKGLNVAVVRAGELTQLTIIVGERPRRGR
jgi:S1-C subfamily serine protease